MFDFVRKHNRIMQFLLFLLIFPSFVLFGIDGYNRMREKGDVVATVNGHDITQSEWDNAHRAQVERMRNAMPTTDVKLFDTPEAKYNTLERLVRDRLLAAAAQSLRLGVSDQRLAQELQQNPNIAALRRADGSLDVERYRQLLSTQGMTPASFESQVRADLASRQVMAGVGVTSFSSPALADVTLNAFYQERQIQLARFAPSAYVGQVNVTPADLEAYYKAHAELFQSSERADAEYVVLDLAAIEKTVAVSEDELKSYYEQNLARLAGLEERRASHILIAADKSQPAAEREKAKAKAQELLAVLQKTPDQFAELARKNSQDPGSASKGGDLDFFGREAMTKPFADAVFAMKKGDISAVVETEFGFHIIRLTDIKQPKQPSFEEQRAKLEKEVRRQIAQRKFAEAAEQFTNLVYEQADSLQPAAQRLKLEIHTAKALSREVPPTVPVLSHPKLLAALFAADATEKMRNTEAVEIGPNQLAAARVTQYTPARTLPFEDVKARVKDLWVAEQSAKLAREDGAAKLDVWKNAAEPAKMGEALVISREKKQQQSNAVIEAALRAPSQTLPAWVGVDLGSDGYAVVKVEKVLPREVAANDKLTRERDQYAQWWASAEGLAYYRLLKEKFKVNIKVARL